MFIFYSNNTFAIGRTSATKTDWRSGLWATRLRKALHWMRCRLQNTWLRKKHS